MMTITIGSAIYTPGMYIRQRADKTRLADRYGRLWENQKYKPSKEEDKPTIAPAICFSRKIGVGALEIADMLSELTGYNVVDRELLEYIAKKEQLSSKTVSLYDERYPGITTEFVNMLFAQKAYIKSEYSRHLFSAVLSIAGLGQTIFVGRGTHLILPRERVLAVRFICSDAYRVRRLAEILNVRESEAESKLGEIDKEQLEFFKKIFDKKEASPYEFDLVINRDYIADSKAAAEIVAQAFRGKFSSEL